jgi:hypothetical protein
MKRQWRSCRTTLAYVNGHQRWDHADQHLLRWAYSNEQVSSAHPTPAPPLLQEVSQARSGLCPGIDVPPSPTADD